MPSGFGELTDKAHHLVSTGDLAGAQRLLADALTEADPRPANATAELAEAASLQARVLVALGEPHSARGWAAYAYAAATRLHGRSDPRTVAAAATLAAVLHRVGSHSRAARLYQDVIIELTAQDGPESLRVLAAHADLATVEYARGQCQVARDRLQDAWELHREVYGEGHPSGIKMLARLGAMQRDCGRFGEAHDHLALARELARQHLPADDPLAVQVAALARAAANPDHVCADTSPATGDVPVVPAARTAPHDDEPAYPHGPGADDPQPDWPGPDDPQPDRPGPDDPQPDWPGAHRPEPGAYPPGHPPEPEAPTVPTPRQPVDDPAGSEQAWWPPDRTGDPYSSDPYSGAGSPVSPAAGPVPPTVAGFAGADEEADGVHRVGRPSEPAEPYQPSRLLPVPVDRAASPARRRVLPLVVAGVVVVLLGTAAVIAGVAGIDGGGGSADPTAPAPSAPASTGAAPTGPATTGAPSPTPTAAAASPGTPPTAVTLRDNRDNVALSWTYPAGGEGPVIISGGRAGQGKSVFTDLPAGTDSFIVYGLNRSIDYCFTVAVVWSTDTVAASDEVCTRRR